MKYPLTLFTFCVLIQQLSTQDSITFDRPSFEGQAYMGVNIQNYKGELFPWEECLYGSRLQSLPDIMCNSERFWNVTQKASKGECFLNLVTRENGNFEGLTQKLNKPIKKDQCFTIELDISYSHNLTSQVIGIDGKKVFNAPTVLLITGGINKCDDNIVIHKSEAIRNSEWQSLKIDIKAPEDLHYIGFFAFYRNEKNPTNGNIHLDNIRPIVLQLCEN